MKNALKKLDDTELNGKRIRLKIVRIKFVIFSELKYIYYLNKSNYGPLNHQPCNSID